jgi:hypothetical protein
LESFIFLAFVLGVNVTGPYHQLQDWPVAVPNTNAIETGTSTAIESVNLTAKMLGRPNVEWGVNMESPPLTSTHHTHTRSTAARRTAATATSSELLMRSSQVPQWAKFGVSNFEDDIVKMLKEGLTWDIFERSLDPYWKVGNMVAIWKKIYHLLWPGPAEKRWELTHAKLINVLREMIDAVPVDKDGAPNKSLIMMARERYNNSLTNLTSKQAVIVSETQFLPPSSSHISASSGFSGFKISTPDDMRLQKLQRSKSASSSGSKKRKAPLDSDGSTSATTSSSVFPSSASGTAGTSVNSSNFSGKEKRQRQSRG